MTLKKVQIKSLGSIETKEGWEIFVRFSYGLKDKKDFESLTERNDQYIFVAFVVKEGLPLYVFGDARRHEELEKAIADDIGTSDKCIYGQLWFRGSETASVLTFKSSLGENDNESKNYLLGFLGSINNELLCKRVAINDSENTYTYNKTTRNLENAHRL